MRKVYLLQLEGTDQYKVGYSKDPEKRLKQLQTGSSQTLNLITSYPCKYASKVEASIHQMWKHQKMSGEWFRLTEEQVQNFNISCKLRDRNFKILYEESTLFDNYMI